MKRGWRIAMWAGLFIGAFLLVTLVVQFLWNWLIPDIFSWKEISYIQALGLLILSKILFKGFFWNRGHYGRWGGNHWKEKWQSMNPEDRERFKQKMREKCGWYKPKDSNPANVQ